MCSPCHIEIIVAEQDAKVERANTGKVVKLNRIQVARQRYTRQ
jgi:large subunit ribosomal protein L17e